MFKNLFGLDKELKTQKPREGDVFKIIELHGVTFEIRYGYYEEEDRYSTYSEPMEIYPDFIRAPIYTNDGYPFVTLMQEPCKYYCKRGTDSDEDCSTCKYMERGDELIAVCRCSENRKESG